MPGRVIELTQGRGLEVEKGFMLVSGEVFPVPRGRGQKGGSPSFSAGPAAHAASWEE